MNNKQEVRIQTWGPSEGTHHQRDKCPRATEGAVEVIGAMPFRTKVKRRKASVLGELAGSSKARIPKSTCGRIGDEMALKLVVLTHGDLPGSARAVALFEREDGGAMTRQKSDDRVVPDGDRKAVGSEGSSAHHGGKAVAVNQQVGQLGLPFATAGNAPGSPGATLNSTGAGLPAIPRREVPKAKDKERIAQPATMEGVVSGLELAFEKVASNDGAPGPDRQTVTYVRKHLATVLPGLSASLLDGSYRPGDIRRVWIPKGGGGERGLGIPNVVDRMVQEATRAVLEPLWEPTFHPSSHGFRPGRSCHTAIAEAKRNVEEGHEWVVDIDLEKFFDKRIPLPTFAVRTLE